MVNVTVVGASGYLGAELLRILVNHPNVDEIVPVSRRLSGKPVSSLHRNLLNVFDNEFVDLNLDEIDCDVAFFAAPPGEWFSSLPGLIDKGVKVITLGGKFRIKDAEIDGKVYGGYVNEELLSERVYGLSEVYKKEIRKARFVTNPGCYPVSIILGIMPLERYRNKIDLNKIVVTAITGTSGAGAAPSKNMHHPEVSSNIKPYNVLFHRHRPEIEFILNESFGGVNISFTPIIADMKRGILSNTTLFADSISDLGSLYEEYYRAEPFVRVTQDIPCVANVVGSNFCDVMVEYDPDSGRILVISTIDNLIKGGSGQAVQNMNLMLNLDEKMGLDLIGGHP